MQENPTPESSGCPFHGRPQSETDNLSHEWAKLRGVDDMMNKTPGREGVQRLDIFPLDLADWMRIDGDFKHDLQTKAALMEEHPNLVNRLLPEGVAGAQEVLELLADYLPTRYPSHYVRDGALLHNLVTNESWDVSRPGENPLVVCGQLVQEDLVLAHRDSHSGSYKLVGGSVAFPSNWSLSQHLGKTVWSIHQAVPELNERIGAVVDGFLAKFPPDKPMTRVNFLVHDTPLKPQFPELREEWKTDASPVYDPATIGKQLFLRNERETFRKLPQTEDILFSLRTYITRFSDLTSEQAGKLKGLLLRAPERYTADYKGLTDENLAAVLDYLSAREAK
jgi:hypothetical protein